MHDHDIISMFINYSYKIFHNLMSHNTIMIDYKMPQNLDFIDNFFHHNLLHFIYFLSDIKLLQYYLVLMYCLACMIMLIYMLMMPSINLQNLNKHNQHYTKHL